jgi:hypothetical protein
MLNAPTPPENKGQDKDNIVEIIAEELNTDLMLVGIWHGKNELAAFTVSFEVWKDESQILEIVNSILLNSGNRRVQWL